MDGRTDGVKASLTHSVGRLPKPTAALSFPSSSSYASCCEEFKAAWNPSFSLHFAFVFLAVNLGRSVGRTDADGP